jgi:hypothetical protein
MSDTNQLPLNLKALKHEDLRTAYQEVCKSYHAIDDFRAKLLGFLPLVSGTGIFFLLNETFTDATKRAFATLYLGPIGLFGFVVTLGLFFYELRGIQKCNGLIAVGQKIEAMLDIDGNGQFIHREDAIAGFIGKTLAACVIYPAVLTAWIFVALVSIWLQGAWWVASLVFFIGFAGSYTLNLKVKLEKEPNTRRESSKKGDIMDPNVQGTLE